MDPLADDYLSISSYSYAANNPIIFIDPTGMYLEVTFKGKGAKELYTWLVNSAFEGQFQLDYKAVKGKENTYRVNIVETKNGGDKDKLTENGKEFYSQYSLVVNNQKYTADMDIVIDDPNVFVGGYADEVIDIGDIAAFPDTDHCDQVQCGPTRSGKILHETYEQYFKAIEKIEQGSDKKYGEAHTGGLDREDWYNGNERGLDGGSAGRYYSQQRFSSKKYGNTRWDIYYGGKKGERTKVKRKQ